MAKVENGSGASAQNQAKGVKRQPRGSQFKAGKKDDLLCDYCSKKGHLVDRCYKKNDDIRKKAEDERVASAVAIASDVSIKVMRALAPAAPLTIAPAASAAVAPAGSASADDSCAESDDDGDDYSDSDESSVMGAADEDEFVDCEDVVVVPSFVDDLLLVLDSVEDNVAWLIMTVWCAFYVSVGWVVRSVIGLFRSSKMKFDGKKMTALSAGDDDAFLQIFRGLDYMMRILFWVAIIPYFVWSAHSYVTLAKGTDYVVTESVLWYCDIPTPDFSKYEINEQLPEIASARLMRTVGREVRHADEVIGNFFDRWRKILRAPGSVGEPQEAAEKDVSTLPWWEVDRAERARRLLDPFHADYCGHVPATLLIYARAVVYGMAALIALVYMAMLRYNFPIHYRPDSVRYTYVCDHEEYNRTCSLGDVRDAGFRSVKADSPDFVQNPEYMCYDVVESRDNVVSRRRVVLSKAVFEILNNPLLTMKWAQEPDFEKLQKDALAYARSAMQRVNLSGFVESKEDSLYETVTMFAWSMRAKRTFLGNFRTPEVK